MLRSRINTLVERSFRGYNSKNNLPPCYLSQDERTIDPMGNYYGCYINYREGAETIGNIKDDNFEMQSKKLKVHMNAFTDSEICQKYCADITVMCNKYIEKCIDDNIENTFINIGSENIKFDIYGNKAFYLDKMYRQGIPIPYAIFLNGLMLQKYYISDWYQEYKKVVEKSNCYNRNIAIKEWIMGQEESDILKKIVSAFWSRKLAEKYVVRSSSALEDGNKKSYAGAFETVLDINSEEDMLMAIRKVFASKYNYLNEKPEDNAMGVIIQKQIEADFSGVMFTQNPLTGEEEIIINYNEGRCEDVVNGCDSQEIIIKNDVIIADGKLSVENVKKLQMMAIKIQKIIGCHADIEWAIADNDIYILQARPITAIIQKTKVTGKMLYVDSIDIQELQKYNMTDIQAQYNKYMEKHYFVRKNAMEQGVLFPKTGYFFYNKNILSEEAFEKIVPKSEIYKVVSREKIRTLSSENIVDYLKSLEGDEDRIVRIQQITLTNMCGNAGLTKDEKVYIEYIPGGFGGFLSGELPFSRYIIDKDKKIEMKEELSYHAQWSFVKNEKKFKREEVEIEKCILEEGCIEQLVSIVNKMKAIYRNPRIEWEMENGSVYLNDISFEQEEINTENLKKGYLSNGAIQGEVRCISDIDELKFILKGRSVIPEKEFYIAERSDALKDFLNRHKIREEKQYVFVMETAHPSASLLIKYAKGFIFEKGGMLSHLAIILRENGIPAKLEINALKMHKDTDIIQGNENG